MAMLRYHVIKETQTKQITALAYNPLKHEIVVGCEDGSIKTWDCLGDNVGKLTKVCREHNGWVNCFLYWSDVKLLLSAANDGKLIAWGSSMLPTYVAKLPGPIYSMAWNVRRNQIVFGMNGSVRVYNLLDPLKDGKMLSNKAFVSKEHTDIVKAVVCHETRIYSVGFDRKFCIYESYAYPGKNGLKLVTCLYPAHEAGITTLKMARDNENNTWLLTGAFDKTVKVWSQDGQMLHKFDAFSSAVTSVAYVAPTKTLWIACGTPDIFMYDPKSGDNVSEFIGTHHGEDESGKYSLMLMQFVPDTNQLIATDSRRQILMWKYNPTGCITALKHKQPVDCLTYTRKLPILVFCGDSVGQITKWERLQSNRFMYSKEVLPRSEAVARLALQVAEKYDCIISDETNVREKSLINKRKIKKTMSDPQTNVAAIKMLFVEDLNLLLVASEDNNIYVWGFDYEAVEILNKMRPRDEALSEKFQFLLRNEKATCDGNNHLACDEQSQHETQQASTETNFDDDSVTNRVAGFICKHVLVEHTQSVSGMAVVGRSAGYSTTYLLSGSWDRRIIVWDLERMSFQDIFRNNNEQKRFENEELASDGIITDLVYCEERNEFAFSSCDKLVYVREFSPDGSSMKLKAVLQGHEADVTQIRWNTVHKKWISASEDCTVRVWSADGLSCELVLAVPATITALCIDSENGCLIVGIQEMIRVYDIETRSLVQTNVGHTEAIRYLIHIPERQQYVSASWDKTVRMWNAYRKVIQRTTELRLSGSEDD